jgi:hypothetical protein
MRQICYVHDEVHCSNEENNGLTEHDRIICDIVCFKRIEHIAHNKVLCPHRRAKVTLLHRPVFPDELALVRPWHGVGSLLAVIDKEALVRCGRREVDEERLVRVLIDERNGVFSVHVIAPLASLQLLAA